MKYRRKKYVIKDNNLENNILWIIFNSRLVVYFLAIVIGIISFFITSYLNKQEYNKKLLMDNRDHLVECYYRLSNIYMMLSKYGFSDITFRMYIIEYIENTKDIKIVDTNKDELSIPPFELLLKENTDNELINKIILDYDLNEYDFNFLKKLKEARNGLINWFIVETVDEILNNINGKNILYKEFENCNLSELLLTILSLVPEKEKENINEIIEKLIVLEDLIYNIKLSNSNVINSLNSDVLLKLHSKIFDSLLVLNKIALNYFEIDNIPAVINIPRNKSYYNYLNIIKDELPLYIEIKYFEFIIDIIENESDKEFLLNSYNLLDERYIIKSDLKSVDLIKIHEIFSSLNILDTLK